MKNKSLICLLFSVCICGCGGQNNMPKEIVYPFTDEEYQTMSDDEYIENFYPIARYTIASDLHIHDSDSENSSYYKRVVQLCTYSNKISENDEKYKKLDAMLIAGDMVDNGMISQYQKVKNIFDKNLKKETKLITTTGNHDYWSDRANTVQNYLSVFTDQEEDQLIKVGGFNVISMCASDPGEQAYFNDKKVVWLDKTLRKAAKDTPNMPIFVMTHYPTPETVYGSHNTHFITEDLDESLSAYPQVVYITGHSHFPIADPRSLYQGNYTSINTGTTSYSCHGINGIEQKDLCVYPSNRYGSYVKKCPWVGDPFEIGDMQILEINKFGSILIRGFDLLTEAEIFKRLVRYPADKTKFITNEMKFDSSVSPEFGQSAQLTVQEITTNSIFVHVPASISNEYIESYRAMLYNSEDKLVATEYALGDQFLFPHPDDYDIKFKNLNSNTNYKLKVYAVNAYNKLSNTPLELDFKTS